MKQVRRMHLLVFFVILFALSACGGTTEEALPTAASSGENTAETSSDDDPIEESDETESIDLDSVELPDVPADLEGMTIDIAGVEDGFDLQDVPVSLNQTQCFGPAVGWILNDDTTNAPPELQMNLTVATGTQPGTYILTSGNPDTEAVGLGTNIRQDNDADLAQFLRLQSGVIRIDSIATAEGESFTGALQFNLRPSSMGTGDVDREQEIQVTGVFNFVATADDICEE